MTAPRPTILADQPCPSCGRPNVLLVGTDSFSGNLEVRCRRMRCGFVLSGRVGRETLLGWLAKMLTVPVPAEPVAPKPTKPPTATEAL